MSKEWKAPQGFEEGDAPEIALTPVNSSQVKAIGYDPATKTLAGAMPVVIGTYRKSN